MPGKVEKLVADAGGYDKVRNDFIEAGKGQFGSGWAWLTLKNGKLEVDEDAQWRKPAHARRNAGARLRRVGAQLLPRLSEPAARSISRRGSTISSIGITLKKWQAEALQLDCSSGNHVEPIALLQGRGVD